MGEYITAFLIGGMGAALIGCIQAVILYKMKRKDEKEDKGEVITKALRYVMLYIIQERCKDHIANGEVTLEERRSLHHWHDLYHNGLGGNGDADILMKQVDKLGTDIE